MLRIAGAIAIGWFGGGYVAHFALPAATGTDEEWTANNNTWLMVGRVGTGLAAYWLLGRVGV